MKSKHEIKKPSARMSALNFKISNGLSKLKNQGTMRSQITASDNYASNFNNGSNFMITES